MYICVVNCCIWGVCVKLQRRERVCTESGSEWEFRGILLVGLSLIQGRNKSNWEENKNEVDNI